MKAFRILTAGLAGLMIAASAHAAGGAAHPHEPEEGWPFEGVTGQFDQASLQRGYQVYQEVCSSCHSMKLLSYRNLGDPGGPFYDEAYPNPNDNPYVKALAAQNEMKSVTMISVRRRPPTHSAAHMRMTVRPVRPMAALCHQTCQ